LGDFEPFVECRKRVDCALALKCNQDCVVCVEDALVTRDNVEHAMRELLSLMERGSVPLHDRTSCAWLPLLQQDPEAQSFAVPPVDKAPTRPSKARKSARARLFREVYRALMQRIVGVQQSHDEVGVEDVGGNVTVKGDKTSAKQVTYEGPEALAFGFICVHVGVVGGKLSIMSHKPSEITSLGLAASSNASAGSAVLLSGPGLLQLGG
jgi:hypothetical protein